MKEWIKQVEKIAKEEANKLELEVLDVDYVLEHGMRILRIIANSKQGLTIDESAQLNTAISNRLDDFDGIEEEYYIEVSSRGLEYPIKNDADLEDAIGKYIFVHLYEKIEKQKEYYGYLVSYNKEEMVLNCNIKGIEKQVTLARKSISTMRHAVKF